MLRKLILTAVLATGAVAGIATSADAAEPFAYNRDRDRTATTAGNGSRAGPPPRAPGHLRHLPHPRRGRSEWCGCWNSRVATRRIDVDRNW